MSYEPPLDDPTALDKDERICPWCMTNDDSCSACDDGYQEPDRMWGDD